MSYFGGDFDKWYGRIMKWGVMGVILGFGLSISWFIFVGWVVYRLLQHFGVI